MNLRFAALIFLSSIFSFRADAQVTHWTIDKSHSEVGFVVRHMGVSNVRGTFGNLSGTVDFDEKYFKKSSVVATIDMTTITTGVSMRDSELKSDDFLNIAKYPTMTFKSTNITEDNGKLHLKGDLTLHGVTRPVTLDMETPEPPGKGPKGGIRGFSASGIIQRDAFGLTKFSGIAGNDIRFTIDLEVDQQP